MPSQSASITASYALDSRTLLSARYGYKYLNFRTNNYGIPSVAYWLYRTPATDVSGMPAEYIGPAGTQNYAGPFVTFKDVTTRHNLYIDGSRVTSIKGQQHIFKAGYAFNRLFNDPSDGYAAGRFDLYWGRSFSRGGNADERGNMGITSGRMVRDTIPARSAAITGFIFRTHGE